MFGDKAWQAMGWGEEHCQELSEGTSPSGLLSPWGSEPGDRSPGFSFQDLGPSSSLPPPCQRFMLSCATWPGLKQSGRPGSTSGQAMSTAQGPMTCTTASMAQTGPPSTTTWALRMPSPSCPSTTPPATQGTVHQSLSLPCSPQNSNRTMWPAIQVCVAAKMGKRWGTNVVSLPSSPPANCCQQGEDRERHTKPPHRSLRRQLQMPGQTLTTPSDELAQGTQRHGTPSAGGGR